MILCDVGNSFLHFYQKGRVWREERNKISRKDKNELIVFISVNENSTQALLRSHSRCFDLAPLCKLYATYQGLGIDRIAACLAVESGVIVDAGSAITIDIMQDKVHLGGIIMPGLGLFSHSFSKISALKMEPNLAVNLESFPQNTRDALSYGTLKPIILTIQEIANNKKLIFTGGDGKFFSRFFADSITDEILVFKGMQKVIEQEFTSKGIKI